MNDTKVSILMATYNGADYLLEQLNSIKNQDFKNWTLFVSDDGSTDNTLNMLNEYKLTIFKDKLVLLNGPHNGFCQNFLSLCANVNPKSDYFVWSDQDDIWLPNKLSQILNLLTPINNQTPALYSGRTILVDKNNNQYGLSPLLNSKPLGFENSLVQCYGGGNTMAFNRAALNLIKLGFNLKLLSHDWWAYQIVSGAGGVVIYDPEPTVRYRQHSNNIVGSNLGLKAKFERLIAVIKGEYKNNIGKNLKALSLYSNLLTDNNKLILNNFLMSHNSKNPFSRVLFLKRSKIYRQNLIQQLALYCMSFFNLL
jgi:glycosyltransferase involved in cell wall biosynthesis